jgi:hypothetical protein
MTPFLVFLCAKRTTRHGADYGNMHGGTGLTVHFVSIHPTVEVSGAPVPTRHGDFQLEFEDGDLPLADGFVVGQRYRFVKDEPLNYIGQGATA